MSILKLFKRLNALVRGLVEQSCGVLLCVVDGQDLVNTEKAVLAPRSQELSVLSELDHPDWQLTG